MSDFGHPAKTLPRALALSKASTWCHSGVALCRVPNGGHSAKFQTLPTVGVWHTAKCRPRVAPRGCFAECQGSRQSLCRVPEIRHSAKIPLPWEALPSVTLGKECAECKLAFAECNRHSAKPVNPVVNSQNVTTTDQAIANQKAPLLKFSWFKLTEEFFYEPDIFRAVLEWFRSQIKESACIESFRGMSYLEL